MKEVFDIDRIVYDDELSLAEGAIRGWDRRNFYYYQLLCALANHYQFDMDTPFNKLPQTIRDVIMQGSTIVERV